MKGRTTLSMAHRLSTVRGADYIAAIKARAVVESGRFHDLMDKKGELYHLATGQLT